MAEQRNRRLESLSEIFLRIRAQAVEEQRGLSDSEREHLAEEAEALDQAAADERANNCGNCGGTKWVRRLVNVKHPDFGKAFPCEVCANQVTPLVAAMQLLPPILAEATWGGLTVPPGMTMTEAAEYAEATRLIWRWGQEPHGAPWLVIAGGYGSGKSTRGALALRDRAEQGFVGLYVAVPDLLAKLRTGVADGNVEAYIEGFRAAPVLFLDDLGVEKDTDWTHEVLFRILDHRFAQRAATIVTTNANPDDLHDGRLADRLMSHTMCVRVAANWPSYRSGERWA
jgi:DNA replication protein DnaC